ncbi:hypothetical protein GCM10014713_28340 [Streptomyces purpureus]|uniref:Protein kinase domain-containing protein n=1 Tax=Streptomyces purpureus TaxID=1951 RepID=A0A918H2U3_9ACTN|nr:hypothetical protein GCM10014713_28340 [Streptomyces purpureus]
MRPLGAEDPGRLGPYTLLGVVGAGGMGTVYLGRDGRTPVAVKTLLPDLAHEPQLLARFRREIRAASAVTHPYVAGVLGSDLAARPPWFATEFVVGPTLGECVEGRGPLPEEGVAALGGALARALDALHTAGIVHRDLKPGPDSPTWPATTPGPGCTSSTCGRGRRSGRTRWAGRQPRLGVLLRRQGTALSAGARADRGTPPRRVTRLARSAHPGGDRAGASASSP